MKRAALLLMFAAMPTFADLQGAALNERMCTDMGTIAALSNAERVAGKNPLDHQAPEGWGGRLMTAVIKNILASPPLSEAEARVQGWAFCQDHVKAYALGHE